MKRCPPLWLRATWVAMLAALPPLQRDVFVLAEYEQLTLDEISRAVDTNVGAVKARLHRARVNLQRMLAPLRSAASKVG